MCIIQLNENVQLSNQMTKVSLSFLMLLKSYWVHLPGNYDYLYNLGMEHESSWYMPKCKIVVCVLILEKLVSYFQFSNVAALYDELREYSINKNAMLLKQVK